MLKHKVLMGWMVLCAGLWFCFMRASAQDQRPTDSDAHRVPISSGAPSNDASPSAIAPLAGSLDYPTLLSVAIEQLRQAQGHEKTPLAGSLADTDSRRARSLRLGDQGPDVAELLAALSDRGYRPADPQPPHAADPVLILDQLPVPLVAEETPLPIEPDDRRGDRWDDAVWDEGAVLVLKRYQRDHGLAPTGLADQRTRALLDSDRIGLLRALENLDAQVRSMAAAAVSAGYDRMIVVNIPSYTLHAFTLHTPPPPFDSMSKRSEAGAPIPFSMTSRVIVGKPSTPTPLMVTRILNLKANPDWSPPASIRHAHHQKPGPNNALGLMRFSTDNTRNIYLHDTNTRQLFDRSDRALSHGCVRVQSWRDLAAWSAGRSPSWVDSVALAGGKTRVIPIDPIPVFIVYSRVDVLDDGRPQKFDDIYGLGDWAVGDGSLSEPMAPRPMRPSDSRLPSD